MPCAVCGIVATFAIVLAPPAAPVALPSSASPTAIAPSAPVTIAFEELVVADASGALKASSKALALEGKRVRVTGFVAQLEDAPPGGFYLCPLPLRGDESGAGIGDLPVHAVVVRLPYAPRQSVPPQKGRVIVTGTFHVGASPTPDDFVGSFHITADRPAPAKVAKRVAPTKLKPPAPRVAKPRGR